MSEDDVFVIYFSDFNRHLKALEIKVILKRINTK